VPKIPIPEAIKKRFTKGMLSKSAPTVKNVAPDIAVKALQDDDEASKKTASAIADTVLLKLAQLSEGDIEDLTEDIGTQLAVYGGQQAAQVVPPGALRRRIAALEEGSPSQTLAGLGGGLGGAAAGAGLGMLTSRIAKGPRGGRYGALSGIPGALAGYAYFKDRQRRKELQELLKAHL